MLNIKAKEFYLDVLGNTKPVLLEIRAKWSGGSHLMSDIIEKISEDYSGQIEFFHSDFDDNSALMKKLDVNRWDVPAIYIFNNGDNVLKHSGLTSRENIENLIANTLIMIDQENREKMVL